MHLRVATIADRPELGDAAREVNQHGFPEFMYHDPVANEHFGSLDERFAQFQFCLLDSDDRVQATGNCIPFAWNAPLQDLPDEGWDWVLAQGMVDEAAGRQPTIASALQIVVRQDLAGTGLSRQALQAMRSIVSDQGLADLVAPVRPNAKHRYPLTPMERYVTWTRPDGTLFDPWLRVHQRAGARLVKVAPRAMRISGTVAQWQQWTELTFPDSGEYVVPGALNPISVDVERDEAEYVEPNVWMHHRLV